MVFPQPAAPGSVAAAEAESGAPVGRALVTPRPLPGESPHSTPEPVCFGLRFSANLFDIGRNEIAIDHNLPSIDKDFGDPISPKTE